MTGIGTVSLGRRRIWINFEFCLAHKKFCLTLDLKHCKLEYNKKKYASSKKEGKE